jgi:cobalamin synthase
LIGLLSAVQQLTRIPVPRDAIRPTDRPGRSFGIVGAGIGAAAGVTGWAAADTLGPFPAAILAVAVVVVVTASRPEDGLARWIGGGTSAIAAVSLVELYRVVALASLAPHRWIAAFLLVYGLSHAAMLIPHLAAEPRAARVDVVSWLINAAVVFPAAVLCGRSGVLAVASGLAAALITASLAGSRGTAADVLGATVVATELAAWTTLVAGWK